MSPVVTDRPAVSVIVPVFNDARGLARCLDALDRQVAGTPAYEVVVVDNGSASVEDVREIVSRFTWARFVVEPAPGSYAARNSGLRLATADVIAFTDADCTPAPDWIEKGFAHVRATPGLGLLAGRIDVEIGDRPTPVEWYDRVIAFPQEQHLRDLKFGATANVFTTRATLDRVGVFEARLKSGGDLEWGQRVAAAGLLQRYADDVVVRHPARRTFAQIFRRMQRVAGGVYAMTCESGTFLERQWAFLQCLVPDLTPPVAFAWSIRRHPDLPGWWARAQVVGVMVFVRYASAFEKIRLKFGGAKVRE